MKIDHHVPLPLPTIRVEKNVPLPPKRGARVVPVEFQKMEIGDSIWVHADKVRAVRNWCVRYFGNGNYLSRREGDGYRIWRTK